MSCITKGRYNKGDNFVALYSGQATDAVPLVAFRLGIADGRVWAQVPGGSSIELSPGLSIQLGMALIELGRDAFELIGATAPGIKL